MRAVSFVVGFYLAANHVFRLNKVVAVNVVNKAVPVVVNTRLSVLFLLVDVEIVHQVFVGDVDTAVYNGNDNIVFTRSVLLPNRLEVAVGTLFCMRTYRTIIVIMPLLGQKRVVKGRGRGLISCLWGCPYIGLSRKFGACDGQNTFRIFHACGLVKLLQHLGNVFAFVEVDGVPAV